MVTASHNDNGWTGVKMGADRPLTFGPEEMAGCKEIVLAGASTCAAAAPIAFVEDFAERYIADLTSRPTISAGSRSSPPAATARREPSRRSSSKRSAARSIPLDAELDHTFPATIPTPKTWRCCTPSPTRCATTGADVGLGFDGDGDRCGVVDDEGHEIFADKIGVMLARDLSTLHPGARFVVDVKSTGLFATIRC